MTWQDYLSKLENAHIMRNQALANANVKMQEKYPGPYEVVEKYLLAKGRFGFELEFKDEKDKIFWLLKNAE